jgi:hypothetical protein
MTLRQLKERVRAKDHLAVMRIGWVFFILFNLSNVASHFVHGAVPDALLGVMTGIFLGIAGTTLLMGAYMKTHRRTGHQDTPGA